MNWILINVKDALAGNRTRAARVAGEHSTTEPPVLALISYFIKVNNFLYMVIQFVAGICLDIFIFFSKNIVFLLWYCLR